MEYRNVGRSGLQVSAAGLGCNNFGMRIDKDQTAARRQSRARPRRQSLRHRQYLRRHEERGVPRRGAGRQAQEGRRRHEVRRTGGRGASVQGRLARRHRSRGRRQPPPPRHRLDRPLPDPLPGRLDADRGNAAGTRGPGPPGQDPVLRLLELLRLAGSRSAGDYAHSAPLAADLGAERVQPPRPPHRARVGPRLPG